jgi:hypothetical protein
MGNLILPLQESSHHSSWTELRFVSYMKQPVDRYTCYQIPNIMIHVIQTTERMV